MTTTHRSSDAPGEPAAGPAPVIALDGVTKRFGRRQALDGVTLAVAEGEVLGLLGSYGAGKSTLLAILATRIAADAGTAAVAGIAVDQDPAAVRRAVGYLPESPGVYRHLSAQEHLEFYAGVHGVRRAQRRALAGALLEVLDLAGHATDDVSGLTKGEQRCLGLASTLVHDPVVLLLDEPLHGLDEGSHDEVRSLVAELAAMGKTIVIAGAVLADVVAMCTSLALLDRGRVVIAGTTAEVRDEMSAALGRKSRPS